MGEEAAQDVGGALEILDGLEQRHHRQVTEQPVGGRHRQAGLARQQVHDQQVGQVAAELRALRPPDVYKLKGIRYEGELLRKKAGKTGAA